MQIYIHVPFCHARCGYCAFYSVVPPADGSAGDLLAAYLAAVLAEMRLWGERLPGAPVSSIFFGGGTPSMLPAGFISDILLEADRHFKIAPDAEISAEANPDSALAGNWLFAVRQAGINRISLGVQSFDQQRLVLLGRIHDVRTAETAIATARTAGFANIGIDLMWALPGKGRAQKHEEWLAELERAIALRPEHISAYGFTLEKDTPIAESCAAGRLVLPDENAAAAMFLSGAAYLKDHGYAQYEISNYARAGFACRHNLGYWRGGDYLGLGPAAVSTIADRRWSNASNIADWLDAIGRGQVGAGVEILDAAARRKELIMLGLRTSEGLALKDWQERFGSDFLQEHALLTARLEKEGLAAVRQGRFFLTGAGMLVSDAIICSLF